MTGLSLQTICCTSTDNHTQNKQKIGYTKKLTTKYKLTLSMNNMPNHKRKPANLNTSEKPYSELS